jgi:hypothetical protein
MGKVTMVLVVVLGVLALFPLIGAAQGGTSGPRGLRACLLPHSGTGAVPER